MARMDLPRNIQTFRRDERWRTTVSSCSPLGMEIKRKKIRQSTVLLPNEAKCMTRCTSLNDSLQIIEDMNLLYIRQISKKLQDSNIQEKIDFEVRMQDGAYKLLVASSKRDQILNASKSLLTCNTRIKAYMKELQKRKEDQDAKLTSMRRSSDTVSNDRVPCKGKVALSGLRIPLMWKDSDHFSNKGSSRRVAVFCLMKMGTEIFDTDMVVVDKSATDICFDGLKLFTEARPQFELTLELYSCAMEEDTSLVKTPKKLAKRLRNSLGKTSGKKLCPLLGAGDPESFLQSNPISPAAKYHLLAYTTLCLDQAEGSFQSHSLIAVQNAECSSWLPLYGNLCCRLVAQPDCMTQDMMSGFLNQQQQGVGGAVRCCPLYCVLKAGSLACFYSPEEIQAKVDPALVIPVNKETRIRAVDKDHRVGSNSLTVINPVAGEAGATYVFTAGSRDELEAWMEAFWQHFYDQVEWQHCCRELMKIEIASPRKPPLFQTRHADSVYNDLSIGSPGKFEGLTDIIHNKIEETGGRFLIGQEEETEAPDWAALFGGSRPLVVQKSVVSPSRENSHSSPNSNATKKRRAPPPPPNKQLYDPASNSAPYVPASNSAPYVPGSNSAPYAPANNSAPYVSASNSAPYVPGSNSAPYAPANNSAPYAPANNSAPYVSASNSAPYTPTNNSAPYVSASNSAPYVPGSNSAPYAPANNSAPYAPANNSAPYVSASNSAPYVSASNSAPYVSASNSAPYGPASNSAPYAPANNSAPYAPASNSAPYGPASNSAPYAPASNSAPYTPTSNSAPYTPTSNSAPYTPTSNSAPYTPTSNSAPYVLTGSSTRQGDKENRRKPGTRTGRPSLDAKFSAIIQQLQKNPGLAQKPASTRPRDAENQPPEQPPKPVPAPRHKRKSFREKINPKAW